MFAAEALQYLRERILKLRVALLWVLLLGGALLAGTEPWTRLPVLALASALFILAFRLWDDLADLDHDRQYHPERCLVRSDVRGFRFAQWILLAVFAGLLWVIAGGGRVLALLALAAAFLAMYRVTGSRSKLRPLRAVLVLAKYPAFVLLLAPHPGRPVALLAALGVYLPPLLDEVRSTGAAILLPAAAFVGLAILAWLGMNP